MFKNTLKRLGAIVLALAMAMSVMMVSAFAATTQPANATITKTIKKNVNTYAPNTTISFEVTGAGKSTDTEYDNPIADGANASSVISIGTATFAPAASDIGQPSVSATATLSVIGDFTGKPGTYYYTVKEVVPAEADQVAGLSYTNEEKTLAVYIGTNGNVIGYWFIDEDAENGKDDGVFENNYENTSDLTITKTVSGSQGDKNKAFTFSVKVTGTADTYTAVYGGNTSRTGDAQTITLTNGVAKTDITLKDGETLTIKGLSAADTYEVTEGTYVDYNTTINNNGATVASGLTASGNMTAAQVLTSADKTVGYTNNKDASTPTGVIMNIAPYVLMVALAGGIAFFFLRRRHAE